MTQSTSTLRMITPIVFGGSRPALETGTQPRLVTRTAVGAERCRCGTPMAPGTHVYAFDRVPSEIASLLRHRSFCSVVCARAFVLETLETFEAAWISTVVGDAATVAAALRLVYLYTVSQVEGPPGFLSSAPAPARGARASVGARR